MMNEGATQTNQTLAVRPLEKAAPEDESQINIKGSRAQIQRFRRIAKRDGLRLIGLLIRATDAYEGQQQTTR